MPIFNGAYVHSHVEALSPAVISFLAGLFHSLSHIEALVCNGPVAVSVNFTAIFFPLQENLVLHITMIS